jgi:peptidoglycan/xylan/chitin deacetylase (PgdA/CDA1 family)
MDNSAGALIKIGGEEMKDEILKIGRRALKSSIAPLSLVLNSRRWRLSSNGNGDGRVLILSYHRVVPDIAQAEREAIFGLVVSVETFRRHLEVVRRRYELLSLDEAAEALEGNRRINRAAAVITFDDGYRDVYDHAFPALREMKAPATVFVSTAYVGTKQILDHDRLYWLIRKAHRLRLSLHTPLIRAGLPWRQAATFSAAADPARLCEELLYLPLSRRAEILDRLEDFLDERPGEYPAGFELLDWEMIGEMARAGISFGAHTERHPILTLEGGAIMDREILESKQKLEAQLGQPILHFAYPNGAYNEKVKEAVTRAGFKTALTCDRHFNRPGADLLALGRIGLCEESTRGIRGHYSETVARLRLTA